MNVPANASAEDLDRGAKLALRSCLLRLLSRALSYPTSATYSELESCLNACIEISSYLTFRERGLLREIRSTLNDLGREGYEREFLRVFTHVCATDCNPCETAYTARHIFQVSQSLATITGIYKAFGLEAGGERPDHIAVELEFLAFLRFREASEIPSRKKDRVEILRRGQRVFLEHHLGTWVGVFGGLVDRKAQGGPIALVGTLVTETLSNEARELGFELPVVSTDLSISLSPGYVAVSPLASASDDFAGSVFSA